MSAHSQSPFIHVQCGNQLPESEISYTHTTSCNVQCYQGLLEGVLKGLLPARQVTDGLQEAME